jgi:hypothetical protein
MKPKVLFSSSPEFTGIPYPKPDDPKMHDNKHFPNLVCS